MTNPNFNYNFVFAFLLVLSVLSSPIKSQSHTHVDVEPLRQNSKSCIAIMIANTGYDTHYGYGAGLGFSSINEAQEAAIKDIRNKGLKTLTYNFNGQKVNIVLEGCKGGYGALAGAPNKIVPQSYHVLQAVEGQFSESEARQAALNACESKKSSLRVFDDIPCQILSTWNASSSQEKSIANSSSRNVASKSRVASSRDAKGQLQKENSNRAQMEREEEERAEERTRDFNTQKQGVQYPANKNSYKDEEADERTRAFNEQRNGEIKNSSVPTIDDNLLKYPPEDGQETKGCMWTTGNFRVTGGGSNRLYIVTGVSAFITNDKGSPSFTGGFMTISNNSSKNPFWFGRSGVINEVIPPNTEELIYLPIYQSKKNPQHTIVEITARYCKERR